MPSILKLFSTPQRKVLVGIVKSKNTDGTYVVASRGRNISVRSSLSINLIPGSKVLLSDTSEETYIFAKDNVQRREQVVIPVDG